MGNLRAVIYFLFLAIPFHLFSQGIEFGLMAGASNYAGDLSNKTIMLSQTHLSGGVMGRYHINEDWAIKAFLGYGRISGADSLASSPYRLARNLNFFSDIYEFSVHMELNLVKNPPGHRRLVPYIFAGIGVFNFNPKTKYHDTIYELQPLGTEGQGTTTYNDRTKYALTTVCIPFGFGLKKQVGEHIAVGVEAGVRFTFTNYLDDVSGTYADAQIVRAANGIIASKLSDRSGEKSPDGVNIFRDGDHRGYKSFAFTDMYFMGGFSVTYVFRNAVVKCPKF
ncbi:MAG: DUF6089 family protein [Bacteroidia bacterium]